MNKTLYHYCSLDTFLKIMSNKTIRLSDCTKTNDSEEIKWITKAIKENISDVIKNNLTFCQKYNYDEDKETIFIRYVNAVIDGVFYNNSRHIYSFICCFSEARDLLSQWRGYSDDGNGVAIGFNRDYLSALDSGGDFYHFKKVEYSKNKQIQFVTDIITDIVNAYAEAKESEIEEDTYIEFVQHVISRIAEIRNRAPIFKNVAFKEEKEWRIYVNNYLYSYLPVLDDNHMVDINNPEDVGQLEEDFTKKAILKNGFVRNPVSFLAKRDNIVPYFDFSFDNVKNDFVKEIVLGPKCKINDKDLILFLTVNGFDTETIKIFHSNCSYR